MNITDVLCSRVRTCARAYSINVYKWCTFEYTRVSGRATVTDTNDATRAFLAASQMDSSERDLSWDRR